MWNLMQYHDACNVHFQQCHQKLIIKLHKCIFYGRAVVLDCIRL